MLNNLISRIKIKKLFGMYTYTLPRVSSFSNAAILYADNGAGKSTVLNLTFHLLSSANNRGHRNALFNANFEFLDVELNTGIRLTAERTIAPVQMKR